MGSDLKPPEDADALAKLLGGKPPATEKKPAAGKPDKKPAVKDEPAGKLPPGKMGEPCRVKRADGSKCPGKLTDLGGHYPDRKAKLTRTTLVCTKCNQVQAISEVRDLD